MVKSSLIAVVVVLILGQHVGGEVHHKVGDERGWDPSINLTSWSSGRLFRLGDTIWFTYAAAKESVVELETIGEFSSCDLTNPIKMYTEGLDQIQLDDEGSRFFASGNLESCKKGLKIHVNVHPIAKNETHSDEPSSEGKDVHPEEKDSDDSHHDGPSSEGRIVPPEEKDDGHHHDGPPPPSSEGKDDDHHHDEPPSPSKGKDVPPPEGPVVPSGSTLLGALQSVFLAGLLLCYLGF